MSGQEFPPAVRQAIRYRTRNLCELCHSAEIVHFHHRLRKSQGGRGTEENCLGVCAKDHAYIHANPAISYANGWLLHAEPVNMGPK
jgi:hypothetical protein